MPISWAPILALARPHLLEANSRLVGGGSPIFLFTDEESLRAGNPLTHPWVNGWGEVARLTD